MSKKIRVSINGAGRVGRNVARQILNSEFFQLIHINDINPSSSNIAYLMNYDSIYGKLNPALIVGKQCLEHKGFPIAITSEKNPEDINWSDLDVDVVVESTGVLEVQRKVRKLVDADVVPKAVITHSADFADKTIIFGVNEQEFDSQLHRCVSSSICDANAVAPALDIIDQAFEVTGGSLVTLHPWLGYQNLSDGSCRSFAYPGHFEENFSLGRSSTEALIPKTTSCMAAVKDVLPSFPDLMSMSYRVPTPVVSTAILTLSTERPIFNKNEIIQEFKNRASKTLPNVININSEQLISKDFTGDQHSCILDARWIELDQSNHQVRLNLWYDNEFGYSARVLDTIMLLAD